MIRVQVTEEDILEGLGGDCHRCAVALALNRATGYSECSVHEIQFEFYMRVNSRCILAPDEVSGFIMSFDDLPRRDDGRIDTSHKNCKVPEPFDFELPDIEDEEWKESCYHCSQLVEQKEVDDEGVCSECRKSEEES